MTHPSDDSPFPLFRLWTPLPALRLSGLATEHVESLSHYMARQLWASGFTKRSLYHEPWSGLSRSSIGIALTNGHTRKAPDLLATLECVTGQPTLRHGTFWMVERVVALRSFSATSRRWCPQCYEEWDEERSWEQLIWLISLVSRCTKHGCSLLDSCASCGARQTHLAEYGLRRRCHRCNESLALGIKREAPTPLMLWIEDQARCLVRLCADPSHQRQVASTAWRAYMTSLCANVLTTRHVARSLARDVETVRRAALVYKPTLRAMLNVAALQGHVLSEMLTTPQLAGEKPLLDVWRHYGPSPLPQLLRPEQLQRAAHCVHAFLSQRAGAYLPPLGSHVTIPFGVTSAVFRVAYPALHAAYVERYEAQGDARHRHYLRRRYRIAVKHLRRLQKNNQRNRSARELAGLLRSINEDAGGKFTSIICSAATFGLRTIAKARIAPVSKLPPLPPELGWQRSYGVRPL